MENRTREIITSVQKAVCKLMDADRFYAMFYDQRTEQIRFPFVWENAIVLPENQSPWFERAWDSQWLPDQAIQKDEQVLMNVESQYWPRGEEIPRSWLAMPVGIEGGLRMALVVESKWRKDAFGEEAEHFLRTISRQAALAIRNVLLLDEWRDEEKRRRAAERFFAVNRISGEFAHKMNNVVGTVPVWIKLARENLNSQDPKQVVVLHQLDEIEKSIRRLLQTAQEIKESTRQRSRESVEINSLVENAIKRAQDSQSFFDERILIKKQLEVGLPKIEVERDSFIDTLTSVMKNGLESMSENGVLSISTRFLKKAEKPMIEIIVSDSGVGISEEHLKHIFDPFFTTKETGMGFGLWRDKTVVEELGGHIDVHSELSKGTTVTIKLPVE